MSKGLWCKESRRIETGTTGILQMPKDCQRPLMRKATRASKAARAKQPQISVTPHSRAAKQVIDSFGNSFSKKKKKQEQGQNQWAGDIRDLQGRYRQSQNGQEQVSKSKCHQKNDQTRAYYHRAEVFAVICPGISQNSILSWSTADPSGPKDDRKDLQRIR